MNFHATFCAPLQPDIIDLGNIEKENVVSEFQNISWNKYLEAMKGKPDNEIYYSPSFEFENTENNNSLSISAVGEPENFEFYIFYKRPKTVKSFWGFSQKEVKEYLTDVTGQTNEDALNCIKALINNDLEFLERKIK